MKQFRAKTGVKMARNDTLKRQKETGNHQRQYCRRAESFMAEEKLA